MLSKILTIKNKCICGYTQDKSINDYLFEMKQIENTNNMNDIKLMTFQWLMNWKEENIGYCLNCQKTGCELSTNNEHEDHDVIYTNKYLILKNCIQNFIKYSHLYKYYKSNYNIIQNKTRNDKGI